MPWLLASHCVLNVSGKALSLCWAPLPVGSSRRKTGLQQGRVPSILFSARWLADDRAALGCWACKSSARSNQTLRFETWRRSGKPVITVSQQAHKALNFLSLIFLLQGFWQAHKIRSSQIHTGDNDYNRTGERYKCQHFFNQFEDCDLADLCRHCKWLVQNFPTYDCITGRSEGISI